MASVLAKTANKGAGASVSGNYDILTNIYTKLKGYVINSSQYHPNFFIAGL